MQTFLLFVTLLFWTFSLENSTAAQLSPDDSNTDLDGSSKNKRPRKQLKGKSQLEKTIKWLRFIHKDKWGLGEYRLWATAFVNCRRCKHSTCMIMGTSQELWRATGLSCILKYHQETNQKRFRAYTSNDWGSICISEKQQIRRIFPCWTSKSPRLFKLNC